MLEKNTKLGDIRFSKSVIARRLEDAAGSCGGNGAVFNFKSTYMTVIPNSHFTFKEFPDGVEITVYVVVRFGASIRKYTKRMMDYIYDNVEKVMGERPKSVKIVVTGVQSKEIAKRHIEIAE